MLDSSPEDEDFPGRLLHQAALWDNTELLEDLLAGGQQSFINSQDSWGRTPLHAAAISENSNCIQILLNTGADPNVKCGIKGENKTPLHLSAEHGHVSNIGILLQHGASLLEQDSSGMTPSDLADKAGHVDCTVLLREAADAREKAKLDIHSAIRDACTRGDFASTQNLIQSLSRDAEIIINMAPSGANTLLFTASQLGNRNITKVLLENGADGRYHPVTKYSPLYIACYHGHIDIVEMLLHKFPELIQQHTVERWLPIHACAINGHLDVLQMLFSFPYPLEIMRKLKDENQQYEYSMPFDINERDASGQNILYVACLLGNKRLLDIILKFKVKARRINEDEAITPSSETNPFISPTKNRISDGIQTILSKLNLSRESSVESTASNDNTQICPLKLNMYCNNNTETALHAAVKGRHYDIVSALLNAGANPNLVIRAYIDYNESMSCCSVEDEYSSAQSTALMEACKNHDLPLVELLLKWGARDDDCKALAVAVQNNDEILSAKLLSIKAHPDPEYKINKKAMTENIHTGQFSLFSNASNITYSTIFPNTPTMINWHNQRCQLKQIRPQWLTDAALHLNPKLKQNPRNADIALYAITRLDLSNNALTTLPLAVFKLASLKYLNGSQNKIEKLPEPVPDSNAKKRKKNEAAGYSCPMLEELYLQDNRLEQVPDCVFKLPSLTILVIANNKLQHLSYEMWLAPKLKEFNASFNLLKDLPTYPGAKDTLDRISVSSSDSQLSIYSESEVDNDSVHSDIDADVEDGKLPIRYRKKERSLVQLDISKHHIWSRSIEVTEQIMHADETTSEKSSQLSALNLAHNLFANIPVVLPCLAVNLTRLNMSFNSLRSMSHITSYPSSLKQLDLSHNQISVWPSLPQVEAQDVMELAQLACYSSCKDKLQPAMAVRRQSSRSVRNIVLHTVCTHRRHLRLDNLRTLILSDNKLTRIQLTTDDDGDFGNVEEEDADRHMLSGKQRLMFPNLSMLDISNNTLREVPQNLFELSNLSVLNISGNMDINELPPQMGLLSRLWNLNTRGCSLQEPLKSMIESKKYKTMDIIGYLKSVLEDAKPYARIKLMIVGVQAIGKTSLLEQLRQEGITRRKPEHWAKRMGNKNINVKTSRGSNMSTVGVDIGDWVYEKKVRNQSSHGPVIFRTWDFGGQREYYATHQYFLSKRSLYLVVWKITDGHKGIDSISQWLVNIQARAPNSPVLIVGTHYDVVQEINPHLSEDFQQIIRNRFINIVDAEKCGLPRVLDTIEISCKTRHNIKLLCNLIYDTVFSLKPPGSKELLLEQKVPSTYLALEDVVNSIAIERRMNNLDPVLTAEQYRSIVITEMQQRYNKTFRDPAELHQATLFLHDNGVLLHYDDATLKDLYFLDPQWLCDMLAHVVTIREINPFARTGIMKLEDLKHIFKASCIGPLDTRGYIVNLLNKFEVALTWDSRTLLIPSLLPSEEDLHASQMYPGAGQLNPSIVRVKVPLRSRGWAMRNKKITVSPKSVLYRDSSAPGRFEFSLPSTSKGAVEEPVILAKYQVSCTPSDESIIRLLLMSYFPSGFWSRLMSRILADDTIIDIIRSFFIFPKDVMQDADLLKLLDFKAEWILWQTGLQLKYGDITLFRLREVQHNSATHYKQLKFKLKQDGVWCDIDLQQTSILEIYFPLESLTIKPNVMDDTDLKQMKIKETLNVKCVPEASAQLLALAVDHIDILLEDWYPTLGTRFVHTSEGKFLITRLVPCPKCLSAARENEQQQHFLPAPRRDDSYYSDALFQQHRKVRKSQESYNSECDSGVGPDSPGSSPMPSVEGHPHCAQTADDQSPPPHSSYSWMVEECILAAYGDKVVQCPVHAEVPLSLIAPDTIFLDLGDRHLIKPENIKKGRLLGRGAFGFVFKGTCKNRGSNAVTEVAMKMLQPVKPGSNARQSATLAYKAAQGKWDRDPLQYACKAYCTARQELNILLSLRHPNIVPFVGMCTSPLALVLDLAPQGALDLVLRHYRRSGAKVGVYTLQAVILQTAKAIEYLHRQHIIYRDLKSENVLVWEMPPPFVDHPDHHVHIKVADYGISRQTLPSGTKGFGGTEGFMAPEIIRYNGEEEYTEKVDCFSFGMFIYELLTLHQPFEGHESVKECILEGGRPPLTYRETLYPSYFLDLMVLCWSQQPKDRPSASQIVSIASAPEFTHLSDIMQLKHQASVVASASAPVSHISEDGLIGCEMWLMCENSRVDLLLAADRGWLQYHTMALPIKPTACCSVANQIWIGDYIGRIHAYSAVDGCKIFSYSLENEENVSIKALLYLSGLKRVACALSNGRLFLLNSESIPRTSSAAEGTFVMTELGASTHINCLCASHAGEDGLCELWSGQSMGRISIYTIKDQVVAGHELLNHYQPVIETVDVVKLEAVDGTVWSYVYPGCIIYQWSQPKREIINKLDCSKLVPCSESLKSIAIEEHLSPTNCQVTSLAVLNDELYIGTTWGCVIIAERCTLRPITIFRPYEEEVRCIVPLSRSKGPNPLIATIGRGYRSLPSRYLDAVQNAVVTNVLPSPATAHSPVFPAPQAQNTILLLWRAEHWNAS